MHALVWMNAGLSAIGVFRFLMYAFGFEFNTRNKLSTEAWQNEQVVEIAYEWTRSLRMLFGFRLLVTFVVCYGGDVSTNWLFLLATVLFNFYFLLFILGIAGPGLEGGGAVQPANTTVPKVLTTIDFLAPLLCLVYYQLFL